MAQWWNVTQARKVTCSEGACRGCVCVCVCVSEAGERVAECLVRTDRLMWLLGGGGGGNSGVRQGRQADRQAGQDRAGQSNRASK